MHYALRPEAAIRAGGSKQRRNHHAQSKVPMDAHGRYPCLRKCGRTFGHELMASLDFFLPCMQAQPV